MTMQKLNIQGNTNVLGSTGLSIREGRITEEYNQTLRNFRARFQFYREMTNDATIATLLDCIKLPLLASSFTVSPGSDQAGDVELAKFIEKNLFKMYRQSWRSHVRDMLEALEYGFALGEIVMEKRDDGMLYVRNIEPRGQETLEQWEEDPSTGTITAFVQRDPVNFSTITIPIDKLVHVTFRGRKGNPEGFSLLRGLYRVYKFKKQFEVLDAIAIERGVGGLPVVHEPEDRGLSATEYELIDQAMMSMRRDEQTYLRLPFGVELSTYPEGARELDIVGRVQQFKMDIFIRGFAQFLTLGTQETGTQALVQGDIDFFHLHLISIQNELLEAWNNQLIPYILLSNNIEPETLEALPQIMWSDPGHVDLSTLLASLKQGAESLWLTPSDADETWLRTLMDMPPYEAAAEGRRDLMAAQNQQQHASSSSSSSSGSN